MTVVEQPSSRLVPVEIGGVRGGPALKKVLRKEHWRLQPAIIGLGLLGFVAYGTWAALRNCNFYAGNVGRDYLSPFYSPCLTNECRGAGMVWGGWSWWRIERQGYLPSRMVGYALALFAFVRGEERPEWTGHLRLDAAAALRAGLNYLRRTDDSLFWDERMHAGMDSPPTRCAHPRYAAAASRRQISSYGLRLKKMPGPADRTTLNNA